MVPRLTTPFRERHPGVTFSVVSRTSIEVLSLLGNFDIDAGITYLDNEPLGRVISVPLYSERYQLITAAGNEHSDRDAGHLGGSGGAAALPADTRHAEPPHHRSASGRGRRDPRVRRWRAIR
jgi:DNA-binding transcriptional LysR family regulator